MSKKFGEMCQIAFVVRDIDKAMECRTQTLGIDPFFIKRNIAKAAQDWNGQEPISEVKA